MKVDTAASEIDELLVASFLAKKPAYLEIPYDLQRAMVDAPTGPLDLSRRRSAQASFDAALDAAVALIGKSRSRSVVTGHLLQRTRMVGTARELVDHLNAAVGTTFVGKIGDFEGHPNAAGLYMGAMSNDATREAIEGADLAIVCGMTPNEFDTGVFTAKVGDGQDCVWIELEQVRVNGKVYDQVFLTEFLPALRDRCRGLESGDLKLQRQERRFYFQVADAFDAEDKALTIDRLFVQFAEFFSTGDVIYGDTGGYINAAQAETPAGIDMYGCGNWGSLGAGFGMFTGGVFAPQAKGLRRYIITGDGAFHMTAQEVSTLIKYDVDCVIFVLDNSGYGAERWIYPGKERSHNDTPVWTYEILGEAMGGRPDRDGRGYVARTEVEMAGILEELEHVRGVNMVRIMLDPWDSASFNDKFSEALRHYAGAS